MTGQKTPFEDLLRNDGFEKFLNPLASTAPDYDRDIKQLMQRLDAIDGLTTNIGLVANVPDVMMQEEKSFPRIRALVEDFKSKFPKNPLTGRVEIPAHAIEKEMHGVRSVLNGAEKIASGAVNRVLAETPTRGILDVRVQVYLLRGVLDDKDVDIVPNPVERTAMPPAPQKPRALY